MNKFTILFLSITAFTTSMLAATSYSYNNRNLAESAIIPGKDHEQQQKKEDYSTIKRIPKEEADTTDELNIVDVISDNPSLSSLYNSLETAGLLEDLSGSGPFTLFAPNDEAFAKLSPNMLDDLLKEGNREKLIEVLKYHVVPGKIDPSNLKTMKLKSANGKTLDIKVSGDQATINNAKLSKKNIETANGNVYIIDTVLKP